MIGGTLVHIGAVSLLRDLVASGHTVTLDDDGDGVTVSPLDDLHDNALYVLDAFQGDLALLLTIGGVRAGIHERPLRSVFGGGASPVTNEVLSQLNSQLFQ